MRSGGPRRKIPPVKIFFVTDLHGSEICWKKFLNAGSFYGADVVILGGDVTGKAMVPIVQPRVPPWSYAASMILSLEKKPAKPGKPMMAR